VGAPKTQAVGLPDSELAVRDERLIISGARILNLDDPSRMKASLLYRIASVLLILFALGHTLGFRRVDPRWKLDSIIAALRSTHFEVQGLNRTYWDFYVGFGLFVTILLLFTAILTWQLGGLPKDHLSEMRAVAWSLAACFVVVTFLSWKYFFIVPVIFSGVVAICLILAALAAGT
jgi:hypothetical protein